MKPMRWYDYITVNLFWFGLNVRNTAVGSVFTPYLVALFVSENLRNSALGFISTAGLVIAMLVQPAAGLLSDRSTSPFGRRRPYIAVGTMLDLVFLIAIALSGNFTMLLIATLLIQFSANVSHGALQGLIPDRVPEEQRGRASAVKAVMELLPIMLVGMTIAQLVGRKQLGWAVFATGAAIFLTMLLTVIGVKEEPLKEKPNTPLKEPMLRVLGMLAGLALGALAGLVGGGAIGGVTGLVARLFTGTPTARALAVGVGGMAAMVVAIVAGVWSGTYATLGRDARRNSAFTWWVINRLLFLAAATSFQGFLPFFLMFAFRLTPEEAAAMNGNLITIFGLFILLSALGGGWLADRLGSKRVVALGGLAAAVGGALTLLTIWVPNLPLLYVAGSIIGLGVGFFMTANWALGTHLVPPEEAGRYLGVSNLAGAGAGMIGKGIGGPVADYLNNYHAGLGYFAIFGSYAVLFIFSVVSLIWVRKDRR